MVRTTQTKSTTAAVMPAELMAELRQACTTAKEQFERELSAGHAEAALSWFNHYRSLLMHVSTTVRGGQGRLEE